MQKLIGFPPVRIILAILFVGIGLAVTQLIINLLGQIFPADNQIMGIGFTVLALLAIYYAYVRLMEKRPATELSGPSALNELALGLLIGLGLFSIIIAILWALGYYYRVTGMNGWSVIIPAIVANVPSSYIQNYKRLAGHMVGAGDLFHPVGDYPYPVRHSHRTECHCHNIGGGRSSGRSLLLTNRLWLPIGIHVAWDFANDGIFGVRDTCCCSQHLYDQENYPESKLVHSRVLMIQA